MQLVEKAIVVERDIISYQGKLTLKGTFEYLEGLCLEGIFAEVDANSSKFEPTLRVIGDTFLEEAQRAYWLKQETLYAVVNCHGEDNGEYTVFYGMERNSSNHETTFKIRLVPEGWYAKFLYCGDMFDIREVRGRGLMLAIEFIEDKDFSLLSVHRKLFEEGFLVGYNMAGNLLRFYPALIIQESSIENMVERLDYILGQ